MAFFNMTDADEHVVKPMGGYHWNTLSAPRVKELLEQHASSVEVISIDGFLRSRFNCKDTHNKGAYTFFVRM